MKEYPVLQYKTIFPYDDDFLKYGRVQNRVDIISRHTQKKKIQRTVFWL